MRAGQCHFSQPETPLGWQENTRAHEHAVFIFLPFFYWFSDTGEGYKDSSAPRLDGLALVGSVYIQYICRAQPCMQISPGWIIWNSFAIKCDSLEKLEPVSVLCPKILYSCLFFYNHYLCWYFTKHVSFCRKASRIWTELKINSYKTFHTGMDFVNW